MRTLIACLIIVVVAVIIYIIKRNNDSEKGNTKKTNKKKSGSKDDPPTATLPKEKTNWKETREGVKDIVKIAIFFIIALLLGFLLVTKVLIFFNERPDKVYQWEDKKIKPGETPFEWVIDKTQTKTISLNGEYGDTLRFESDDEVRFSFVNSTVPYCVKNGDGIAVCGGKGEDLAYSLPKDSYGNGTLMFKAKEKDMIGQLTLYVWIKQYER